jgi:hypothetical protein
MHAAWPLAVIGALSAAAGQLDSSTTTRVAPPPAALLAMADPAPSPAPQAIAGGKPVTWWFAYKFSSSSFPTRVDDPNRDCPFGGTPIRQGFSQRYVSASSANPALVDGPSLLGASTADPLGATFAKIYGGKYYFVVWNDQFKDDPVVKGPECTTTQCGSPWGHSKGILAWDKDGNGVVIQVTTPSWPGSGSAAHPRAAGNTLGCVTNDNDVSNAQDFFALTLKPNDVKMVLQALALASVSTDIANPQLVNRRIAGAQPLADLDAIVATLGRQVDDKAFSVQRLSSNVLLIAKPSALHVPPWQFVSSVLGGEGLQTATWWAQPRIASTRSAADVHCWDPSLKIPPGRVDVAVSSIYESAQLAFTGGPNHAKIGTSLGGGGHHYAIFGDLNQQGKLGTAADNGDKTCASSQNGRGGMFFVLSDPTLSSGISKLITGKIAPYPD